MIHSRKPFWNPLLSVWKGSAWEDTTSMQSGGTETGGHKKWDLFFSDRLCTGGRLLRLTAIVVSRTVSYSKMDEVNFPRLASRFLFSPRCAPLSLSFVGFNSNNQESLWGFSCTLNRFRRRLDSVISPSSCSSDRQEFVSGDDGSAVRSERVAGFTGV